MEWKGQIPPPVVSEPFHRVLKKALEYGAPKPQAVVFLDDDGRWREILAFLPVAERRAVVAVAPGDEGLAAAARYSLGGGVLLPPSVERVSAACKAARDAIVLPSWTTDLQAIAEISGSGGCLHISLQPRGIWDAIVGLRGQLELLAALASTLDRPPLIGGGPVLLVTGAERADVLSGWKRLEGRPTWCTDAKVLVIVEGGSPVAGDTGDVDFENRSWAVAAWPSGKIMGRWRFDSEVSGSRVCLEAGDGVGVPIMGVATSIEIERAETRIVRLEGVSCSDLERTGSPGAVFAEVMAREADRLGHTLWIPGVSKKAGALIRAWGVSVWVDGLVLEPRPSS
jgi:hypothetical protein